MGLGLAIVKRTTELLLHSLNLTSIKGDGSSFGIILPRSKININDLKIATAPEHEELLCHVQVLVIDDEKDIREAMSSLLKRWGASVTTAANKEELEKLIDKNYIPDVIISDYRLPKQVTGSQMVTLLRESYNKNIPAMLVTGDTAPIE